MEQTIYFNANNAQVLYNVVDKYCREKLSYLIGKDEYDLLINLMKDLNEDKPKNVNPIKFRNFLNKKTLNIMINAIKEKVIDLSKQQSTYQRPKISTTTKENENVMTKFESLNEQRKTLLPETKNDKINFQEPEQSFENPNKLMDKMVADRDSYLKNLKTEVNKQNVKLTIENNTPYTDKKILNDVKEVIKNDKPPQAKGMDVLIPQPKSYQKVYNEFHEENLKREFTIVVDSRDRNHDLYSAPNDYKINLKHDFYDVFTIELLTAEIPKSNYVINSNNNKFYFQELNSQVSGGTYYTATITPGNYTASELVTQLKNALDAAGAATYTVTLNTTTNKYTITSDLAGVDVFNVINAGDSENYGTQGTQTRTTYIQGTIAPVIGFNRTDKTGSSNYTSDNQYDLSGEKYILLSIDEIENIESINSTVHRSFAKISLDTSGTVFYKNGDYQMIKKNIPPIAKLSNMRIRFLTYEGYLYDFNGLEHSLTFKITTLGEKRSYFS